MTAPDRGPGVPFPPPFLFVAGFLAGLGLDRWLLAFEIDNDGAGRVQSAVGLVLMAAGLALVLWGIVTFARARTAIIPHRPARLLVLGGPYRFSRNPMYVGLTALYLGLAIASNLVWPILLLPLVLWLLVAIVIRREERHLTEKFGEEYRAFCRQVRRWI